MSTFSERLRTCRKATATQKAMANHLEISERAYQHYEAGTREPNLDMLCKLADFFDVSTDYLLCRTDKPEVNR